MQQVDNSGHMANGVAGAEQPHSDDNQPGRERKGLCHRC